MKSNVEADFDVVPESKAEISESKQEQVFTVAEFIELLNVFFTPLVAEPEVGT